MKCDLQRAAAIVINGNSLLQGATVGPFWLKPPFAGRELRFNCRGPQSVIEWFESLKRNGCIGLRLHAADAIGDRLATLDAPGSDRRAGWVIETVGTYTSDIW